MNFPAVSLLLVVLLAASSARAQFFTGPEASACGGSGRASVDLGESAFLNPAAVAFIQRYNVSAMYGVGDHPVNGNTNEMAISIVDGTSDAMINGGATYVNRRTELGSSYVDTQQDVQISLAGFFHRKLAFGLAGHRISDGLWVNERPYEYTQINMHMGTIYVPVPNVGIGFVAYDMLPSEDLPAGVKVIPTLALGVNYMYEKFFRARLDFVRPDTDNPGRRVNVMAGMETFMMEQFAIRFGGFWRETHDQAFATFGLAYLGPRLSLDYSFQKDVRIAGNSRHLIDLWLPF